MLEKTYKIVKKSRKNVIFWYADRQLTSENVHMVGVSFWCNILSNIFSDNLKM